MGVPEWPAWKRPYGYLRTWVRPRRWWWQLSAGWVRPPEEHRLNQFSVVRNHALYLYRHRPHEGDVLVLRAQDEDRSRTGYRDPSGWDAWVRGDFSLVDVPGGHRTMTLPPFLTTTAQALRAHLDARQTASGAASPASGREPTR